MRLLRDAVRVVYKPNRTSMGKIYEKCGIHQRVSMQANRDAMESKRRRMSNSMYAFIG